MYVKFYGIGLWIRFTYILKITSYDFLHLSLGGGGENAGPENDGQKLLQNTRPENDEPRKSQGLKMQDVKMPDLDISKLVNKATVN